MLEKEILSVWNIAYAAGGDNALITGSPNRSESRFIFRADSGMFYIAEGYALHKKQAQIRQNQLLEFFAENKLPGIYPFLRTQSGAHGADYGGLFWQIRPYIPAGNIQRTALAEREEYGDLWGDFLLKMKSVLAHADKLPPMPNAPFYMSDFFPKLLIHAERKMPTIVNRLLEFERLLVPFFKWERKADGMFAHGDFHPGNILTAEYHIKTVIDWEFAGVKFPGYDMALLIGCLAMDHPDNLASPAVTTLCRKLYSNGFMPADAWEILPQLIAAARLGWLGEWLTLEDTPLIYQEMELLSILLER